MRQAPEGAYERIGRLAQVAWPEDSLSSPGEVSPSGIGRPSPSMK
jgi:hypothetical protein